MPRDNKTGPARPACCCAKHCTVCTCETTATAPEIQLEEERRQRVSAAIQRFANRPRHRRQAARG